MKMNSYSDIEKNLVTWWNWEDLGRPAVRIIGIDGEPRWPASIPADCRSRHTDPDFLVQLHSVHNENMTFFGEAFPFIDLNMGPGSMAAYLGSEPIFEPDTVWYREIVHDQLSDLGELRYLPEQYWWKDHMERVRRATELVKGTPILTTIPDILENLDILALLRSPQELCYDLIDEPETVERYIEQIDAIYFHYYDAMYDIVKNEKGGCSYTAFSILAPDRCAKIQCDFSALMSPSQFERFVIPSLEKQCRQIPYTLYHLDGPDALRHVDALMRMEKLNALNWVPGAAEVDAGSEKWYPLYDKVVEAGKSLWISIEGNLDDLMEKSRKLIRRYGSRGMYFLYPVLPLRDAEILYAAAENNFR